MDKLHIGVVVPVLAAFPQFARALHSVQTRHWWQPYIGAQWENNRSISSVWNQQSGLAFDDGCDYVLIINDDIKLYPWTVDALIDELSSTPDLHLVSGESTDVLTEEMVAAPLLKSNLNFSCFMITPQLFSLVGYFDENFYPAYFEDNDMHYRMTLLNLPAYGIKSGQFYHEGSVTSQIRQKELGQKAFEDFENCRQYYICKWGGKPGEENFTQPYDNPDYSIRDWTYIA